MGGDLDDTIRRARPKPYRFRDGYGIITRTMALAPTYRRRLRERALDQYGYVTTRDANAIGVPPGELRKLSARGGLEHVGHGLYRFEDIPRTGRDQFMEAVLRVGGDAYLEGDAVLALHDLALANPRRIRVATPRRDRRKHPDFLAVERRNLPAGERAVYEGIPATTVARALLDCRGVIMDERLIEAAGEAARTGLLRRRETQRVLSELGVAAPGSLIVVVGAGRREPRKPCPEICPELSKSEVISGHIQRPEMAQQSQKRHQGSYS